MRDRYYHNKTHGFRNAVLSIIGIPTMVAAGGGAYMYRDASDHIDDTLARSTRAFDYLATAPPSKQAASSLELTPNASLLLNSIGAWIVEKSAAAPQPANTVRLHVSETSSLVLRSLTLSRQAAIPTSKAIPEGTTDITAATPTISGAACTSDNLLTIQEIDVSYQGKPYELTNVKLLDQCTAANGMHGSGVTIHGVSYLAH